MPAYALAPTPASVTVSLTWLSPCRRGTRPGGRTSCRARTTPSAPAPSPPGTSHGAPAVPRPDASRSVPVVSHLSGALFHDPACSSRPSRGNSPAAATSTDSQTRDNASPRSARISVTGRIDPRRPNRSSTPAISSCPTPWITSRTARGARFGNAPTWATLPPGGNAASTAPPTAAPPRHRSSRPPLPAPRSARAAGGHAARAPPRAAPSETRPAPAAGRPASRPGRIRASSRRCNRAMRSRLARSGRDTGPAPRPPSRRRGFAPADKVLCERAPRAGHYEQVRRRRVLTEPKLAAEERPHSGVRQLRGMGQQPIPSGTVEQGARDQWAEEFRKHRPWRATRIRR